MNFLHAVLDETCEVHLELDKMMSSPKKVFVALSGGVDSSTAAALLCREGFDCVGVFMITSDSAHQAQVAAESVAEELGIKLYVLDLRKDFEYIIEYFCNEYTKGRTPNPCIFCNRYIKFGKLWDFAHSNGAHLLATGHYAKVLKVKNEMGLFEACDTAKDQSYVLSMVQKDVLRNIVLPMGDYSKQQTREIAKEFGLGTAHRKDSQEICFIPNDDYIDLVEQRCPDLIRKGDIIDSSGNILGEHYGIHRFTIGQRRGLGVAMGKPYYVVKISAESNTITLGPKDEVMHKKLQATGVNWLTEEPSSPFRAKVKVRYNHKGAFGTVSPRTNSIVVDFDEPVSAITPGQLAAFYTQEAGNSRLIGGGWIDRVVV